MEGTQNSGVKATRQIERHGNRNNISKKGLEQVHQTLSGQNEVRKPTSNE